MKTLLRSIIFIYAIIFLLSIQINAQESKPSFTMTLANDDPFPDNHIYDFDVYIFNTGTTPIELATISLALTLNNDAVIEDRIDAIWRPESSELSNLSQLPSHINASTIIGTQRVIKITGNTPPGSGNGSLISSVSPGTRIGRLSLMNMAPFYVPALNPKWEFVLGPTIIDAYIGGQSTDITSSGTFNYSLSRTLEITSPIGNEIWQTKTPHTITWNCKDDGMIRIELTTDNSTSWVILADSIKAVSGCYTFTAPDSLNSDNCRIRLTSISYGKISTSPSSFSITSTETPGITVTSPNAAVKWKYGTNQNITWSYTGNIENVKIEFSPDGGYIWNPIINSTPASAKSYNWIVPPYIGKFNSIRISDVKNAKVSDVSDKFLTISRILQGTLIINSPNGGESWKAGTIQSIKWYSLAVPSINIYYSSDGGTYWNLVTSNLPTGTGYYFWSVPNIESTNYLVKIEDAADPTLFSISEKPFAVYVSENPTYTMTLTDDSFISTNEYQFDIYLQRTGLKIFELSSAKIGLTYNISVINGGTLTASIVPGSIDSILLKSGQEIININTETPGVIKIDGYNPPEGTGTGAIISDKAPGIKMGRMKLVNSVPFNKQPLDINWCFNSSSDYQTKISAFVPAGGGSASTDITDSTQHFISLIGRVGPLSISSPKGGEFWKAGVYQKIEWTSTGINYLSIYFSSNGGTNWTLCQPFFEADSSYTYWTPPNITSTNCRIKLVDALDTNTFIVCNSPFTVWQPIQSVQTPGVGQVTQNFGATNVDIAANVKTAAPITVVYNYLEAPITGALPDNLISVSKYYWVITSSINFSNGKISTPLYKLTGVVDSSKLVWLKRTNPGDAWINIGADIIDGNLVSTIDFTSFHEFAIGIDTSHILNISYEKNLIPKEYSLMQNYPNPFNPATTIKFSIPNSIHVKLCIYNSLGQEIAVLISQDMNAGVYSSVWNASGFASGVYFYRIIAGSYVQTKKLLLLK